MAIDFPSSPSTGDVFTGPTGISYVYDGSWTTIPDQVTNPFLANPFKYRSIYTHGFTAGGYKNSTPWNDTNKTVHATDTTSLIGATIDYAMSYCKAGFSDYNMYIYCLHTTVGVSGTDFTHTAEGGYTSSISMITESGRSHDTNWDTAFSGGNNGETAVVIEAGLTKAHIVGETSTTGIHNYVTEVMATGPDIGATVANISAMWASSFGETVGFIFVNYSPNSVNRSITYSTGTWSGASLSYGGTGWGKMLSTKDNFFYVRGDGDHGTSTSSSTFYKINSTTGSNITTTTAPSASRAEENYHSGQDVGYSIGEYDGVQVNTSRKFTYPTDTITTGGTDLQPKGADGRSSAASASAAAQFVGV